MDDFSKAVGEVLRDARRSCGLTLAAVSVRSAGQFKASVLGSYERGEKKISLDRFTALAGLYGFPSCDLLARVITVVASSIERRDEVIDLRAAEQKKRIMMDYGSPSGAAAGSMSTRRSPPSAQAGRRGDDEDFRPR